MFPYQIVAFLEPAILGEGIYHGDRGWRPQVALKRRFRYGGSEEELIAAINNLHIQPFELNLRDVTRPEDMPVQVIEVDPTPEVMTIHRQLLTLPGVESKFPDREGDHYYPHVTVEWEGKLIMDTSLYANTQHSVRQIWLVKDRQGESDTRAIHAFGLYADMEKVFNDTGEVVKAGCVVFDEQGRILLIKDDVQPKWSLPKGHVEPGETAEQAAARETEEETGLAVQIIKPLGDFHYNGAGTAARLHLWLAKATGHQSDNADEHWEWVEPKQAAERLWPEVVDFLRAQKLI